ncbi:MAG: translation initiation factor IF-1 [Bacilli bacterium]|jgi:translation initiation factor IF-1
MAKEDMIVVDGKVIDRFPNSTFEVELDNGVRIKCMPTGNIRRFRIRIVVGDRVRVELSPYDLTKGRISYRYK